MKNKHEVGGRRGRSWRKAWNLEETWWSLICIPSRDGTTNVSRQARFTLNEVDRKRVPWPWRGNMVSLVDDYCSVRQSVVRILKGDGLTVSG